MHAHTRGLLVLVTLLVGCGIQRDHSILWPGARASGITYFGGEPKYDNIAWAVHLGDGPPTFSVRLPGGQIIKPDELTIAKLKTLGATEWKPRSSVAPHPAQRITTRWRIKSSAGTLSASFDDQNRLKSVDIRALTDEGTVFVGDRNGQRMIPLPASRDELVELFGEPERENSTLI
jgi:hypothetical protein